MSDNNKKQTTTKKTRGNGNGKTVFVTVGTTLFVELVDVVIQSTFLNMLKEAGYTKLIIQYGKGPRPSPIINNNHDMDIELYDYKSSLTEDMLKADLILCHAGAGTLTEALAIGAVVVTVINNKLMDNHQIELAYALHVRKYLYAFLDGPDSLLSEENFRKILNGDFKPKPYPPGRPDHFVQHILNPFWGFT